MQHAHCKEGRRDDKKSKREGTARADRNDISPGALVQSGKGSLHGKKTGPPTTEKKKKPVFHAIRSALVLQMRKVRLLGVKREGKVLQPQKRHDLAVHRGNFQERQNLRKQEAKRERELKLRNYLGRGEGLFIRNEEKG